MVTNHKHAGLGHALTVLLVSVGAVAAGTQAPAVEKTPAAAPLMLSEARTLAHEGGRNPTVAVDRRSGAVYLAWAQEVPGGPPAPLKKNGKRADPKLEVLLARSGDGGRHFGPPVVVNSPRDRVFSFTVNPTQVAVGPKGEVYVLYPHRKPEFDSTLLWGRSRQVLRLARSDDGGRSFAAPIEVAGEAVEGVLTSVGLLNLFVAPNGDLYASWLDFRERFSYVLAHKKDRPPDLSDFAMRPIHRLDVGRCLEKVSRSC